MEICGADVGEEFTEERACRLNTGHDGEHLDQCPSTIGRRGEGENRDLVIYRCDGPVGHGGVHHNEEHHHAWNPEGYPPAEPTDKLTGRRTEDIIREMSERLTRLEEQPTLTELATSLGRIMERLNVVEENADRVVKIAENLRVRSELIDGRGYLTVPSGGQDRLAVAALNHHLGKLTTLLSERLPESPSPRCGHAAPSSSDLCELQEGHDGRHRHDIWTWPRADEPEPCPVTVRANVSGSTPWNCILHRDHGGMHTDSEGYTWTVAGV